jgi:hypothetical protein
MIEMANERTGQEFILMLRALIIYQDNLCVGADGVSRCAVKPLVQVSVIRSASLSGRYLVEDGLIDERRSN